jgi:hypothetical protein
MAKAALAKVTDARGKYVPYAVALNAVLFCLALRFA